MSFKNEKHTVFLTEEGPYMKNKRENVKPNVLIYIKRMYVYVYALNVI